MTARPPTREELIQQDIQELHRLGYAQQLFREMGGFSNFAISFSIISILTGAVLLYGYGLKFAGPIINSVGWPVVSLLHAVRGGLDGGAGVGVSYRGRAVLLGLPARRPHLGVDDGVAEHDRADHHHRRHQRRRGDLHRRRRHPHHGPAGGPGRAACSGP